MAGFVTSAEEALQVIEREPLQNLLDAKYVEKWLEQFGLEHHVPHEHPLERRHLCGRGLRLAQYFNQFSKYLVFLAQMSHKCPIKDYLEMGVFFGGTFLVTVEYLRRFNDKVSGYGIDVRRRPLWAEYKHFYVWLAKVSSLSDAFATVVANHGKYDLVFIDGDHSYDVCKQDYLLVRDRTNMLAFHDIVSDVCPGVVKVWGEVKKDLAETHKFKEFAEQYPGVEGRFRGIGIAWRKSWRKSC